MKVYDFVQLTRIVLSEKNITATAKLVMADLYGRAFDDKDTAYPGMATIAKDIGESVSSVKRGIKQLVDKGWVEVKHRKDPTNPLLNLTNIYKLTECGLSKMTGGSGQNDPTPPVKMNRKVEEQKQKKEYRRSYFEPRYHRIINEFNRDEPKQDAVAMMLNALDRGDTAEYEMLKALHGQGGNHDGADARNHAHTNGSGAQTSVYRKPPAE